MISLAPLRSFRRKTRPTAGDPCRDQPLSLRLQREALRLKVLLKVDSSYGFDPDREAWWFQTELPVGRMKGLQLLFLLDCDYPFSSPKALYVPCGVSLDLPSEPAGSENCPEGWRLALCPVPAWRPNDDLQRPIAWFKSLLDLRPPSEPIPPVPLEYEI